MSKIRFVYEMALVFIGLGFAIKAILNGGAIEMILSIILIFITGMLFGCSTLTLRRYGWKKE